MMIQMGLTCRPQMSSAEAMGIQQLDKGTLGQCERRCGDERHHSGTYATEHGLYPVPLHDVMQKHGDGKDDEKGG